MMIITKINERRPRLVREKAAEVIFDAARGLRPLHLRAPDVSPVIVLLHYLHCCVRLCCCEALGGGRSEQNRSDIKQRAAPSCTALEGSLDVLLDMKGADGGAGPGQRKASHVRGTQTRIHSGKDGNREEKTTQTRTRKKV